MLRHVRAFRSLLLKEEQTSIHSKPKGRKESVKCDGHTGRQFFIVSKTISSMLKSRPSFPQRCPLKKLEQCSPGLGKRKVGLSSLESGPPHKPSVQFTCSVMPNSLWPHGLQHARPPHPSLTPGVYSDSCPLSQWCHPTISSTNLREQLMCRD